MRSHHFWDLRGRARNEVEFSTLDSRSEVRFGRSSNEQKLQGQHERCSEEPLNCQSHRSGWHVASHNFITMFYVV